MWIGEFSGNIKLEVIVIGYDSISQFDHRATRLLEGLKHTQKLLVRRFTPYEKIDV
jgi:hypothetical protein